MSSFARSVYPERSTQHSRRSPLVRTEFVKFSSRDVALTFSKGIKPYVVVIFGRTGVGISSLVNLIIGHPASRDHPNAKTSAQSPKPYAPVTFPGSNNEFCLYEVPGFRGDSSDATILDTIREIDRKEGIDLFIYCLRKQKATILPKIVRHIRQSTPGSDVVPMIAVVTELERFEAEGGMDDWWDAPLEEGGTNGRFIERMCFMDGDAFDAHACVTMLPRREVDLIQTLRKRRERSEEQVRRLILEKCSRPKRAGERWYN